MLGWDDNDQKQGDLCHFSFDKPIHILYNNLLTVLSVNLKG